MNLLLVIVLAVAVLGLTLCVIACLRLVKRSADEQGESLQLVGDLLRELSGRLQAEAAASAPADLAVPEPDVQAFVDDFYRDIDLLAAVGLGTGEVDANGSYPAPTPEELAALDASIRNEQFQPPVVDVHSFVTEPARHFIFKPRGLTPRD